MNARACHWMLVPHDSGRRGHPATHVHYWRARNLGHLTPPNVLDYTRRQSINNKLGKTPPLYWLIFMADGARRSRLLVAFENHGEVVEERTTELQYFDLRPTNALSSLVGRLVIEWSRDAVNWAKTGLSAAGFPIVDIADPETDPLLRVRLRTHHTRRASRRHRGLPVRRLVDGPRNGARRLPHRRHRQRQLYVGKADGGERLLGPWATYARDGHGGNVALRELAGLDPTHARHLQCQHPARLRPQRPNR